ncbi:hypothetical protein tb265_46960 [Gemmatimonadetes bacterium T265]|nr:hypothetical protein tb265_46960 [Gemmatimonadetes bacterium T265]
MNARTLTIAAVVSAALAASAWRYAAARQQTRPQTIARLQQGWTADQEDAYYHTPQGTVIMPAAWLAALRDTTGRPFMAPQRMARLGFIADDRASARNPYRWPIGFAVDDGRAARGVPTVGLTCAACHTGQLRYRGQEMRVNGGQGNIDLDRFKDEVTAALAYTGAAPERRHAFEARAVQLGYPADRMAADFEARYRAVVASAPARARIARTGTVAGPGRNDAVAVITQVLFNYAIGVPTNTNEATAPVSYPHLWDIHRFDWVQYSAFARQPMSRNIGEALGVGALTNFVDPATGALRPEPQRWRTSIPIMNLFAIEQQITTLKPPVWPAQILGAIDGRRAAVGRMLFAETCAGCHGVRELAGSPSGEWSMKVVPLRVVGTDAHDAENFANTTYDGTKLGLSKAAHAAEGTKLVTDGIRLQAYRDLNIPAAARARFDGYGRANQLVAPCGYKARPLVGVWATAPFLHNGSVATVFDLLSESRPARVAVGHAEYDPVKLGLGTATGPDVVTLDSAAAGNSTGGHWFTDDANRPGRIGRRLSDAEKYAILEYLKTASYGTYPRVTVPRPDPLPCVDASTAAAH